MSNSTLIGSAVARFEQRHAEADSLLLNTAGFHYVRETETFIVEVRGHVVARLKTLVGVREFCEMHNAGVAAAAMPVNTNVTKLAGAFGRLLRAELGASKFAQVVSRNAVETNAGVCHSHDFCDANMTMAAAFEVVVGRAMNLQSDADTALWTETWSEWKARPVEVAS